MTDRKERSLQSNVKETDRKGNEIRIFLSSLLCKLIRFECSLSIQRRRIKARLRAERGEGHFLPPPLPPSSGQSASKTRWKGKTRAVKRIHHRAKVTFFKKASSAKPRIQNISTVCYSSREYVWQNWILSWNSIGTTWNDNDDDRKDDNDDKIKDDNDDYMNV